MKLGVVQERFPGERRVALVPAAAPGLVSAGLEVLVQEGAGQPAGYPDGAFRDRGAVVVSRDEALSGDVLIGVRVAGAAGEAGRADTGRLRAGQVVIGMADPLGQPERAAEWARTGVTLFALELLPRITRAQSMDVLSSQATVAGYRAVLLAAGALPKMFPMLMTAAGTIRPARVLVLGVGVAGLQAIATARRLGGVVTAYDVRPAVKEQVESLGARFLQIDLDTDQAEGEGGYAREMEEASLRRQRERMGEAVGQSDVVITTAAVPGKRAPILVTADMVRRMQSGSVVVDVAAERGGNCELTRLGEVVEDHGVRILGPANLPSEVPFHASQMYSKNISQFVLHWLEGSQREGEGEDEILSQTLVARDGQVVHPGVLERLARLSEAGGAGSAPAGEEGGEP